jgi:hypothetical protein
MANAKMMLGLILLSSADVDTAGCDGGGINHEELVIILYQSRNKTSMDLFLWDTKARGSRRRPPP